MDHLTSEKEKIKRNNQEAKKVKLTEQEII